jgi:hypothetical protein
MNGDSNDGVEGRTTLGIDGSGELSKGAGANAPSPVGAEAGACAVSGVAVPSALPAAALAATEGLARPRLRTPQQMLLDQAEAQAARMSARETLPSCGVQGCRGAATASEAPALLRLGKRKAPMTSWGLHKRSRPCRACQVRTDDTQGHQCWQAQPKTACTRLLTGLKP